MICEAYGSEKIYGNLRNITYYVHQNSINLFGLILSRLQLTNPNLPSLDALATVLQNRKEYVGKRREQTLKLSQYNSLILGLLKGLCRMYIGPSLPSTASIALSNSKSLKLGMPKPIYMAVADVIRRIDKPGVTAASVRELIQTSLNRSLQMLQKQGYIQAPESLSFVEIKAPYLPPLESSPPAKVSVATVQEVTANLNTTAAPNSSKTEETKQEAPANPINPTSKAEESQNSKESKVENKASPIKSNEEAKLSPSSKAPNVYTLVLDLDETLVHYTETNGEGKVLIRPGAEKFLEELSQYYELVIFTAAMNDVWLISKNINTNNIIVRKLGH